MHIPIPAENKGRRIGCISFWKAIPLGGGYSFRNVALSLQNQLKFSMTRSTQAKTAVFSSGLKAPPMIGSPPLI